MRQCCVQEVPSSGTDELQGLGDHIGRANDIVGEEYTDAIEERRQKSVRCFMVMFGQANELQY